MTHTPADDHDSATDSKFYLPAGGTPESEPSVLARLWTTLFKHQVQV